MADFLTSLAMRIADAHAVRPRLPALFEPSRHELPEPEAAETVLEVPAVEPRESESPPAADAESVPARTIETARREAIAPPAVERAQAPRDVVQEDAPHPATAARQAPREPPMRVPVRRAPVRRARPAEPTPQPAPLRDGARGRDRAAEDAPEHEPRVAARVVAPPADPPAPPRPALVAPRTRFDEWREPDRAPARGASEPVIHVTIGRVEVRAVTAPRAPGKPSAPSPVMSLEDYLRLRAR